MKQNQIICGDCLTILRTLSSESVDCIVTSPPYWALRDYGVDGQLGLESTFQEYNDKLCGIFDEVKRVLKNTGTCWVNLGDTYSGNKDGKTDEKVCDYLKEQSNGIHKKATITEKCLCQIPSRFAIEMTTRGWILRNEIIWHKPNCMPSSIKDRFTVDFEKVFLFVKSKKYYFETQYEPVKECSIERLNRAVSNKNKWVNGANGQTPHNLSQPRPNRNTKIPIEQICLPIANNANTGENNKEPYKMNNPHLMRLKSKYKGGGNKGKENNCAISSHEFEGSDYLVAPFNQNGRNKRCVWTIPTHSFKGAHFATFPEALVEPIIKAGCPQYICNNCGMPKEKIYSGKANNAFNIRVRDVQKDKIKYADRKATEDEILNYDEKKYGGEGIQFNGYRSCSCNAGFHAGVVLDPFGGAGTVGLVAKKLGRDFILMDINEAYCEMARKRISSIPARLDRYALDMAETDAHHITNEVFRNEKKIEGTL